jgi:translation initiation factor 2B subunit (eIF-2B alpha/beta/delta family)
MSEAIERVIAEIAGEKSDGATSLALRGLDAMELLCDGLPDDPAAALERARGLARRIDRLRPSMAAIGAQAVLAVARAEALVAEGVPTVAALAQAIRTEREMLGQASATIAGLVADRLGPGGTIATCSWSVAAMRALLAVRPSRIVVGEGHRLGDGLRAAKWLAARGIDALVVPDAALPEAVRGARACLVGADQVLADGSVVNRSSTFPMALAARHFGVPFYVACQRIKLSGNATAEIEASQQLFGDLPAGVAAWSPLFDVTPAALVDAYFTESGPLSPAEAGEVGAGIAGLRAALYAGA